MSPQERKLATQSGALLAREFTSWAKKKYRNQKPTFGEYLSDLAGSKQWRDDWFDQFNDVLQASFDKHILPKDNK